MSIFYKSFRFSASEGLIIIILKKKIIFLLKYMSHTKLKVQFRPRKISASNSKQKYTPYRSKQKKSEYDQYLLQSKQKIAINEPLIRFKRHLEFNSSKNKLKIALDERITSAQPNTQIGISNNEAGSTSVGSCHNCELLLRKIDEQTAFLQQNLKEINNTLKLPKLVKGQNESEFTMDYEQYTQNQKTIIRYLDQIKNRREESIHLKNTQHILEQEILTLRKILGEWEVKGKQLEIQLGMAKTLLANQGPHECPAVIKPLQDAATSSRSITNEETKNKQSDSCSNSYKEEMRSIMGEIMERHSFDFQKIMNELQQIKLENDMLREEVKLLNYAMDEKDSKINVLKHELIGFIQSNSRSHRGSPIKSSKSSIKHSKKSKKVGMKSMEVSIQCIEYSDNKDHSITQKRTSSILVTSNNNMLLERLKSEIGEEDRKSDQKDTNYHDIKRGKTMPISHFPNLAKRGASLGEEDKLTIVKPFLKLSKKQSIITKHEKQQLDRQKNELMYFSESKLRDLDLIRRTLKHRFKGFKFTFQQLQTQMLTREDYEITYDEMDKILAEYPFSLERRLRQITLEYVLREPVARNGSNIPNDLFCNRLRELLVDYQDVEEQQERLQVQKLKKKIYLYLEAILNQCLEVEDRHGLVSQENLKHVLQQFKLSNLEIELFINQCSLLSTDADHLDYKQYLSIFQNDQ